MIRPSRLPSGPRAALLLALLPLAATATAQQVDCANPSAQVEMNHCAHLEYKAADDALNIAYGDAIARAERIEADALAYGGAVAGFSTVDTLRQAQRHWIAFRDAACTVDAQLARGGTMMPLLYSVCLTQLTQERTAHLTSFTAWPY